MHLKYPVIFNLIVFAILAIGCSTPKPAASVNVIGLSRSNCVKVITEAGVGTGFFINPMHVGSCLHVLTYIQSNNLFLRTNISIELPSGEKIRVRLASVPTADDRTPLDYDFAILKLESKPKTLHPPARFAKASPKIGDEIWFSGYPLHVPMMLTHKGLVSGSNATAFGIQGAVNKGNSGGSVYSKDGEVLGIITLRHGTINEALKNTLRVIETGNPVIRVGAFSAVDATKNLITTLDDFISPGIGYAFSASALEEYLRRHPALLNP